jgi:hypothetical protein
MRSSKRPVDRANRQLLDVNKRSETIPANGGKFHLPIGEAKTIIAPKEKNDR